MRLTAASSTACAGDRGPSRPGGRRPVRRPHRLDAELHGARAVEAAGRTPQASRNAFAAPVAGGSVRERNHRSAGPSRGPTANAHHSRPPGAVRGPSLSLRPRRRPFPSLRSDALQLRDPPARAPRAELAHARRAHPASVKRVLICGHGDAEEVAEIPLGRTHGKRQPGTADHARRPRGCRGSKTRRRSSPGWLPRSAAGCRLASANRAPARC